MSEQTSARMDAERAERLTVTKGDKYYEIFQGHWGFLTRHKLDTPAESLKDFEVAIGLIAEEVIRQSAEHSTLQSRLESAEKDRDRWKQDACDSDKEHCELYDALGFRDSGDFREHNKSLERLRDLVAKEGELGDLKEAHASLQSRNQSLEKRNAELEGELNATTEAVKTLKTTVSDFLERDIARWKQVEEAAEQIAALLPDQSGKEAV